jgi:hypothetical protein
MKPQRTQRLSLCPPKEFSSKEIKEKVKAAEAMNKIYGAQL